MPNEKQPFVDPHHVQHKRVAHLEEAASQGTLVMMPSQAHDIERRATLEAQQAAEQTAEAGRAAIEAANAADQTIAPDHRLTA